MESAGESLSSDFTKECKQRGNAEKKLSDALKSHEERETPGGRKEYRVSVTCNAHDSAIFYISKVGCSTTAALCASLAVLTETSMPGPGLRDLR